MSNESSSGFHIPDTPVLDVSYNGVQSLAADVESALSHLKMSMDLKFDTITALLEKKLLLPVPAGPESTRSLLPEKPWHLPTSHEPQLEKEQVMSPAAASFPPKVPNGESAEKSDMSDKLMPIAIVGMGCRFPQDATSPEKLWDMILRKESGRSDIPSDRFNVDAFYHPDSDRNGMVSAKGILRPVPT
jgi:hypothetical protein